MIEPPFGAAKFAQNRVDQKFLGQFPVKMFCGQSLQCIGQEIQISRVSVGEADKKLDLSRCHNPVSHSFADKRKRFLKIQGRELQDFKIPKKQRKLVMENLGRTVRHGTRNPKERS